MHREPHREQENGLVKSNSMWHAKETEEVIRALQSDLKGFSVEKAEANLREFGYNELKRRKRASPLQIFLAQFKNIFVIMLLVSIIISGIIGWYEAQAAAEPHAEVETYVDAIAIGAIVILNAVVGFVQEYRSEKAMEAMEKLTTPRTRVLRGGRDAMIPAKEIVPGDILLLETGDRIATDARLLEAV